MQSFPVDDFPHLAEAQNSVTRPHLGRLKPSQPRSCNISCEDRSGSASETFDDNIKVIAPSVQRHVTTLNSFGRHCSDSRKILCQPYCCNDLGEAASIWVAQDCVTQLVGWMLRATTCTRTQICVSEHEHRYCNPEKMMRRSVT